MGRKQSYYFHLVSRRKEQLRYSKENYQILRHRSNHFITNFS